MGPAADHRQCTETCRQGWWPTGELPQLIMCAAAARLAATSPPSSFDPPPVPTRGHDSPRGGQGPSLCRPPAPSATFTTCQHSRKACFSKF